MALLGKKTNSPNIHAKGFKNFQLTSSSNKKFDKYNTISGKKNK
jgi:hypothetical protein